jgi:hypothetical protein
MNMVQATFKVYFDDDPDEPVLEARITTETREGRNAVIGAVIDLLSAGAQRVRAEDSHTGEVYYDSDEEELPSTLLFPGNEEIH